ncbi:MAG: sulfatase [Planctomycetota bacterium]
MVCHCRRRGAFALLTTVFVAFLLAEVPAGAARPNILLICVDDLRPELRSFGAEYIHSPNIDALAAAGRAFHRHYVNAPSCGPSRYALLTGLYPTGRGNRQMFDRAEELVSRPGAVPPSMPEWFRQRGYATVSVGKVSHHPGGRGGEDWDRDDRLELPGAWDRHLMPVGPWEHPRGAMHGLSHGQTRDNTKLDLFEAQVGPDTIYPDGLIAREGLRRLQELAAEDGPFFLAVGLIKPHLPFGVPKRYLDRYDGVELPAIAHREKPRGKTTWHSSGEFMRYNRWGRDPREDAAFATEVRRHYAACVTYADKHVGDLLTKLKETGADASTIVVLWGDHGWHLGEHAIWGKHSLFEESLRSPLIIAAPGMVAPGAESNAVVETVDLFRTLCGLTGLQAPTFAMGQDLAPLLQSPDAPGHAAVGRYGNRRTIRTATHRLITHADGGVELYDHTTAAGETRNLAADQPALIAELRARLDEQLGEPAPQ